MSEERSQAVKITRPNPSGVLSRKRLFQLIDRGRKKSVVWISGPAGSGKTTLVAGYLKQRKLPCLWYQVDEGDSDIASFFYYMGLAAKKAAPRVRRPLPLLTPEYLQGVPTFTRRYFEELFRRLTPPRSPSLAKRGMGGVFLVLDNFQDASSPAFREVISCGMEAIPEGINVIVLSRSEPPVQLARLRANNKMTFIGWSDLSFTLDECRAFLKAKGGNALSDETARQLHKKTDGWAAGLVLMTEMAKTKAIHPSLISELSREAIFNYFASEIFEKTDGETRDFLLKTSFFPSMTAVAAEQLTGNKGAHAILSKLSRHHYFTDRRSRPDPVYQYHPLFREFLQSQANSAFNPAEMNGIMRSTAALLEDEGRIEDAAALFMDAGAWERLVGIILGYAQSLVVQGRHKTLEEWILGLPGEIRDKTPWLLYWLGVCRLAFNPSESRGLSERAFYMFDAQEDDTGALLSWTAVIHAAFHEWDEFDRLDPLIEWLYERIQRKAEFPSPEIEALVATGMTTALLWRHKSASDLRRWTEKALMLTQKTGDVNLRLQAGINAVQFYVLTGDFANAGIMGEDLGKTAQTPDVAPLMKILCEAIKSFAEVVTMTSDDPMRSVLTGLEEANKSDIHMWDHMLFAQGVYCSLNEGDISAGGGFLKNMKASLEGPKCFGSFLYHLLSGWYCLLRNETIEALAHAENALKYILESGALTVAALFCVHFEIAQVMHELRDYERASAHMRHAGDFVRKSESAILEYMHLTAEAQFAFDRGEQKQGLNFLGRAMTLGRKQGYISMFWWWRPDTMSRLCTIALEHDIEMEYVRKLIIKRGLTPERPIEEWPYPIKIYTLGNFRLLKDDVPMEFTGKGRQKPLSMLKTLIAIGGIDVSERRLADILWPDADGDSAHSNFDMTLHRLRNILGRDNTILLAGRLLSLDPRYCWVDLQAFEDIAKRAEAAWSKPGGRSKDKNEGAVKLSEKALAMYRGPFLPNDAELDCTTAVRERVRKTALQLAGSLGSHWEDARKWRKAIECYRKGIEIDNLFEDFYRRLMVCHTHLGQRAEAVRTYDRCRSLLSSTLGIEPSEKTRALYAKVCRTG